MDRRSRSFCRRRLLTASLLTGGLGLLGAFRPVLAEPSSGDASGRAPGTDLPSTSHSTSHASPATQLRQAAPQPTPILLPGTILPSTIVAPSSAGGFPSQDAWYEIGRSLRDNSIRALRLGSGPIRLALMGSIHGGWERNTERLVLTAHEHFVARPGDIPSALSLFIVPTTNPDGLALGNGPDAAWNARGVDLNRNFDTANWSPDTFGRVGGRYGPTGMRQGAGGSAPFSEPETQVMRDFILGQKIDAVISYHSGIVSVSARDGGGGVAEPLARQVAVDTGYPYVDVWTEYRLTGQFMDWLDDRGVKGVEVDLPNQQEIDWEQNLRAIRSTMAMLAAG
jgi:hypothetical protein